MTEEDVENLYVSEDPLELEIEGVTVKYKELSGIQFAEISEELGVDPNDPQSTPTKKYFKILVDRCVIEPELDIERLKTGVLVELMTEIQGGINVEGQMENLR